MAAREVRLAVVGTGVWAQKVHFPALHWLRNNPSSDLRLRLHGVCSLDQEAARSIAETYGFERVYGDLNELIADAAVDALAVIVMPAHLPEMVARLQAKGVPILTEKPPGANSRQTEELHRLCRVPHVIGFNRRFAPLNVRLKQQVERMREPYFAEGRFYRHGRLDPDFIQGTGVHMINLMEYCVGPIASAQTRRFSLPSRDTWNWITDLRFVSGMSGRIQFFPCSGTQTEQIEIHGPEESALLEGASIGAPNGVLKVFRTEDSPPEASSSIDPDELPACGSVGGYQALFNETQVTTLRDPDDAPALLKCGFVDEYRELMALAAGQGPSRSTFASSLETMRLAEAIEEGRDYVRPKPD